MSTSLPRREKRRHSTVFPSPKRFLYTHETVKFVLKNVSSLVPTLTTKAPGSTAHVFLTVQTASCDDKTGIDTVCDCPALHSQSHRCQVIRRYKEKKGSAYGMSTFVNPTSSWLGVTTELTTSVRYTWCNSLIVSDGEIF